MTIVAEREFMIIEGAELRPARVLVFAPEKISDNEWKCEYRLVGFSKDRARKAYGVDSYQALYLALKRMLDASPGERQAMGMASYQRCAARFDWHKVAQHFVDLFTSMARR